MTPKKSPCVVLIIGSAPDAVRCQSWPKSLFSKIVAINNAWRVRTDWDQLVAPDDFPPDRMPSVLRPGQRIVRSKDYVPANNRFGGVFYAGGTMAFTTGYWALDALRPSVLAFVGCDMVYAGSGNTHFYGKGAPDPLRDDFSLRSLEAKSARLMVHAARQGCACVRLSTGPSRLVFPTAGHDGLHGVAPMASATMRAGFEAAKREEDRLDYRVSSGRYWEMSDQINAEAIDALDALWLAAAAP